jgi:hypothetical protein
VSKINPPVLPQPVAALVSALGVIKNVMLVVTPVMAIWTVELQVLAETDPVLVVNVVFATWITAPAAVGVAAAMFADGSTPLTSAVRLTAEEVIADSFTPSPVAGAAACRMPAVTVAGSLNT